MEVLANSFKMKTAVFMASHFRSKTILNAIFLSFLTLVAFPTIISGSEPQSALLAIVPSTLVIMILWFAFTNKYINWFMQISTNSSEDLNNFRAIGFALFLCGAFYHCIDFLGTENTTLWSMGLTFLALMIITIGFWLRYAIKRKFWTIFF